MQVFAALRLCTVLRQREEARRAAVVAQCVSSCHPHCASVAAPSTKPEKALSPLSCFCQGALSQRQKKETETPSCIVRPCLRRHRQAPNKIKQPRLNTTRPLGLHPCWRMFQTLGASQTSFSGTLKVATCKQYPVIESGVGIQLRARLLGAD